MSILISNVLVDNQRCDIAIEGSHIASMRAAHHGGLPAPALQEGAPAQAGAAGRSLQVIDGTALAAFPGLVNGHTHAAMSLFRGFGDDLPLETWLRDKIWPNERHLDDDIVYWGSRLACLEMIKSGTTCFNDMYFLQEQTARAAADSGMRAVLSLTGMDFFDPAQAEALKQRCRDWEKALTPDSLSAANQESMLRYAVAPHAIYTVSGTTLQWLKAFANEHRLLLHIHLAETQTEVNNCLRQNGKRPVAYLQELGLLSPHTIVAHGLWLDDDDVKMLGDSGASVVHNPNSNLKLASGCQFRYNELRDAGANVALGTDGCSSSNNLDLIEATKTMSLLQKGWRRDPVAMPAREALRIATRGGAQALNINGGELKEGRVADLFLVNLDNLAFVPDNDTVSNLIYAAHGDCVDTTIINGRIVMRHRQVPDEQRIIQEARRAARRLIHD